MLKVLELKWKENASPEDEVTALECSWLLDSFRSADPEAMESTVSRIREYLEEPDLNLKAIMLMQNCVSNCCDEIFLEHGFYWTESLLRHLQGDCSHKKLIYGILKIIFTKIAKFADLNRAIGEKLVPRAIKIILMVGKDDQWLPAALHVLAACLVGMPQFCIQLKEQIQKFLIAHSDSVSDSKVEVISTCYCHLVNVRDSTFTTITFTARWTDHMMKMISTLAKLSKSLFQDLISYADDIKLPEALNFPKEPEDDVSATFCYTRRFITIAKVVAKMISYKTEGKACIPLADMVDVIRKPLEISYEDLKGGKASFTMMYEASILPAIHLSTLNMLESIILVLPKCLYLIASDTGTLLFKLAKMWYSSSFGNIKVHSGYLLSAIYKNMRLWIEKANPSSLGKFTDELSLQLLEITKPVEKESVGKNKNPKLEVPTQVCVCTEALLLLSTLMYSTQRLLTEEMFEEIQRSVVKYVTFVQMYDAAELLHYSDEQCRLTLYKLLLSVVAKPQLAVSSFMNSAIKLFRDGKQDPFVEISHFCYEACAICNALTFPQRSVHVRSPKTVQPHLVTLSKPADNNIGEKSIAEQWFKISKISQPSDKVAQDLKPQTLPISIPRMSAGQPEQKLVIVEKDLKKETDEDDEPMECSSEIDDGEQETFNEEEGEGSEDYEEEQAMGDDDDISDDEDRAGFDDSNINGFSQPVVNENGLNSSDEDGPSEVPTKRQRTSGTDVVPEPLASTSKPEDGENAETSASEDGPSIDAMIQDFVPSVPEASKS